MYLDVAKDFSVDYATQEPNPTWKNSCVGSECTFHQLSPYIGKIKSSIAEDLIKSYTVEGDLIIDPFSGSGTIPLEAIHNGRNIFASDVNPYAKVLTMAKLFPPSSLDEALSIADKKISEALELAPPDLRSVPKWIRKFFHPKTLKEAINFSIVCKMNNDYFLFACFLGILHHQRPGFLSHPSSHLVPYLRDKNFPENKFPELYEYRDIRSRLIAKVKRAFRRSIIINNDLQRTFHLNSIQTVEFPIKFDCLITSPPYMNTLNYIRDNRLRLWFVDPKMKDIAQNKNDFFSSIKSLCKNIELFLKKEGHCILIVGERLYSSKSSKLSKYVIDILRKNSPSLKLMSIIKDEIPDIRRSRKNCKNIKAENILVYKKI